MPKIQSYENHTRYYPLNHFVLAPFLAINLIYQTVRLYQEPSWDRAMFALLSVAFILMILAARLQVLKVQDRVIRLEEQLRYGRILPSEAAAAFDALDLGQLLSLRFASDEELPDLIARTRSREFANNKAIKKAIKNWRPDDQRA
jgi:hypothetical protein